MFTHTLNYNIILNINGTENFITYKQTCNPV